jgi:hypothetical protein
VAISVILLVLTVTWFYWPRGDARFVGKWDATFIVPRGAISSQKSVIELFAAGTGTKLYSGGSSRSFVWTTDGNAFIEGWPTTWQSVNEMTEKLYDRLGWDPSAAYWVKNKIETQTDNAFELSCPVPFSQAKFTRLP